MEGEEYSKDCSVAGLMCCIIQYSSQGGPGGPVAETAPIAGGPGSIPGQGTESLMPQLKDSACHTED